MTVKIRWSSFKTITRSRTLAEPTCLDDAIFSTALDLAQTVVTQEGIRLLGLTVSGLSTGAAQGSLFGGDAEKKLAIANTVDKLRGKFGADIVSRGRLLNAKPPH